MIVRLHRLAIDEIDAEVDYYESRRIGLGAELEDEIDAVLSVIEQMPLAAPQWKSRANRRVAAFARFPFTMPYQLAVDDIIVLALAHTSRRPGYWSSRR